jgi:hypothetical protein
MSVRKVGSASSARDGGDANVHACDGSARGCDASVSVSDVIFWKIRFERFCVCGKWRSVYANGIVHVITWMRQRHGNRGLLMSQVCHLFYSKKS